MLEVLIFLVLFGLAFSSQKKLGFANPFQIYFLVWFFTFTAYYLSRESLYEVSPEFWYLMLVAKCASLLILLIVHLTTPDNADVNSREEAIQVSSIGDRQKRLLLSAQIVVIFVLPIVYNRAIVLSDGESLFSVLGFVKLRIGIADSGGYGALAYVFVLSYVVTSVAFVSFFQKRIKLPWVIASFLTSLCYLYLTTGRTAILQFALMLFAPLVILKVIRLKGALVFAALVFSMFVLVAAMTSKGIAVGDSLSENLYLLAENLRGYTIAPMMALHHLIELDLKPDWGQNVFRSLIAIGYALGISDLQPVSLVKEFVFVPDATNVYTVYGVYFRDFNLVGMIVPPLYLILHWLLYRKARRDGGVWIYYYAASVFPLVMQFFQDEYVSLLSTWLQIGFWHFIFVKTPNKRIAN